MSLVTEEEQVLELVTTEEWSDSTGTCPTLIKEVLIKMQSHHDSNNRCIINLALSIVMVVTTRDKISYPLTSAGESILWS